MNKIDLCYTGGFKSQKWEQTIVRRTKFFQQFSPKYLVIQCIELQGQGFPKKPHGFSKKNSRIFEKTQGFPKKLNASEATSLSRPPKKCSKN